MGYWYPAVLNSVFSSNCLFSSLFISSRQMPALTQWGKWSLPADIKDEEDGLGNIDAIGKLGILAQWAVRHEVAQEQEAAQEPAGNQVCMLRLFLIVYVHHAFLQIQDDNAWPPTPPQSSPLRQEGRNINLSPVTQRHNSLPVAQRCRSHSSSLELMPSPSPNRVGRTPPVQLNGCQATSSPTHEPLMASVRSNIPRAEGNAQQPWHTQPSNAIASSSWASGHQAPPPLVMTLTSTSTSQTKGKKSAPARKQRKKNW